MKFTLHQAALASMVLCLASCGSTGSMKSAFKRGDQSSYAYSDAEYSASHGVDSIATFSGDDARYSVDLADNARTYRFGFDRYDLTPQDMEILSAHADYLATHPEKVVRVEGHTDERGSREYNIALGERRAKAVRNLLISRGVNPQQISVVSYGEEKPESFDHDETAYSINRRAVLVYEDA